MGELAWELVMFYISAWQGIAVVLDPCIALFGQQPTLSKSY